MDKAIPQRIKKALKLNQLFVRNLNARQHPAIVGAVIAIVKQTDIQSDAMRVRKLSKAPGRSGNSKRSKRSWATLARPPTM